MIDVTFRKPPKRRLKLIVKEIKDHVEKRRRWKNKLIESITVQPLPDITDAPLNVKIKPDKVEYIAYAAYMGIFEDRLKIKDPKIIVFRNIGKALEITRKLKGRLRDAYKQLKSVECSDRSSRKVICVDISDAIGITVLPIRGYAPDNEVLRSIENSCRNWLLNHPDIDSIILTIRRLYLDPFGNPYCTVIEYKPIVPYTVFGWTIMSPIVPMPQNLKLKY